MAPILYEKERVGYVYNGKTLAALQSSSLPALNAENAIQAPLTETGQPVGNVYVEPQQQQAWTEDEAQLAEDVAQRASLQIQNLRLLAAAERARAEAQAATRRFTHEGWEAFLDAIHQNERIGYAYNQEEVAPFTDLSLPEADIQETVNVLDEQVGQLFLETNPDRPLTAEDKALVAAVARQVGQQVENLRLLADASRARADAEETTRLLSRENWQAFAAEREETALGFLYNSNQVLPLSETSLDQEITHSQPLSVQGEVIGQLAISGEEISPENADLFAAVASRVSIHLETLRLNEQLRRARRRTPGVGSPEIILPGQYVA